MRGFKTTILASLLVAGILLGSDPRQAVLGAGFISDENDIITNPAYALDYDNFVRAELGDFGMGDSWGTANMLLGDNLAVGLHFNREDGAIYSMVDAEAGYPTPINGIGIYGATKVGDMNVGLGIYNASKKMKLDTEPSSGDETNAFTKSGVFSAIAGIEAGPIAASFGFGMNSMEDDDGSGNITKNDGGMQMYAEFWSEFPLSDKASVVPIASFNNYKYNMTSETSSSSNEEGDKSYTALSLGVAAHRQIKEEGLVSLGLSFDMMTDKDESVDGRVNTMTAMNLPRINLGLEVPFFATELGKSDVPLELTARAGMRKAMLTVKDKTEVDGSATTTDTENFSESNADFIALGMGVEIAGFTVDMTISENLLYTGTYIISGNNQNLSSKISVGYNF